MPQIRHFPGVNSVTNIEPDTGFMPVAMIKMCAELRHTATFFFKNIRSDRFARHHVLESQ